MVRGARASTGGGAATPGVVGRVAGPVALTAVRPLAAVVEPQLVLSVGRVRRGTPLGAGRSVRYHRRAAELRW